MERKKERKVNNMIHDEEGKFIPFQRKMTLSNIKEIEETSMANQKWLVLILLLTTNA